MLLACWSAQGGSGTTVVSVALALLEARLAPAGALLVDLAGDVPAALGLPDEPSDGVAAWLAAGPTVPPDALHRLEVPGGEHLALLPRGGEPLEPARADALAALLAADDRPVVVDCGALREEVAVTVAAAATRSLLVTRPCYLALRRALAAPIRPSEVVLLSEPGRALGRTDVEQCLGVPVTAEVAVDPAVARAVDAGVLALRLPRRLARELGRAA